ncbi:MULTISPECIES: hypothetical protein [Paenibacillus]
MASKNDRGYEIQLRHYQSQDCSDCSLKAACTKAIGNRPSYRQ